MKNRWILVLSLVGVVALISAGRASADCNTQCSANNCDVTCGSAHGYCNPPYQIICGGRQGYCVYECGDGSTIFVACFDAGCAHPGGGGGGSPVFKKVPTNP